mmetsp:Transcript_5863/g.12829  ORF Transcript_5863/g.12829 Transcript_5863/m.12829 type:complete len:206 (-) Transcript_5863:477-1094(-)
MRDDVSELKSVEALIFALTTTFIACSPNSSELVVSKASETVGATQTINVVFAAPPMAFDSNRVSFESRNGGRSFFPEDRISMHRPRVVSDRLIALASSSAAPSTPDFLIRSEPAKSTRYSFPLSVRGPPVHLIEIISAACERDESAFILVAEVARLPLPLSSVTSASFVVDAGCHVTPSTYTPSFGSSRSSIAFLGARRSVMESR